MISLDIWGQGALFAFSGLEGRTVFDTQLVGFLLGDHPGVHFVSARPFELYVDTTGVSSLVWDTVASDLLLGRARIGDGWQRICFVFRSNATVVGLCPAGRLRLVFDSGEADPGVSLRTAETEAGCLFCLSTEGAAGCSLTELEELIRSRAAFLERLELPGLDADVGKAYLHAVSVMKSQVCSPEGIFRHRWTTPDRYPHRKLWLWDSCFHSLGNRVISEQLAMDSILALLDTQQPDGMIPHLAAPGSHSAITQPPVIAWSVEKIVRRTGSLDFAARCWGALEKYLQWDMDHRRSENGLFFWHINRDQATNRCDESGMDNCSRFDDVEEMECIDFSCFMKREADAMRYLAEVLGKEADARKWADCGAELCRLINERLWDEETRIYCDFELKTQRLHRFQSVCSFLPLFAGVCSGDRQEALIASLKDPEAFGAPFPIPSISMSDPSYGTDMWCGPVWINYVYLVAEGLYRCGERELADTIVRGAVLGVTRAFLNDGVCYEFYDGQGRTACPRLRRKGAPASPYLLSGKITQNIRDYGWTATLFAALVYEHAELFAAL